MISQTLSEFLLSHKASNGSPITHTSFIGGKYNIPHEDYKTFQEFYFNTYLKNDLFLIERNSKVFKFYADIDFDPKQITSEITPKIIQDIVKIYLSVLQTSNCIVSIRNFNKIHINFPDIKVTSETALNYRKDIITKCISQFPDLLTNSEYWETIIDKSVYKNGGLRMLGSLKNNDNNNNSRYKLYDYNTNTYPDITFDIFQQTCTRINTKILTQNILIEPNNSNQVDNLDVIEKFIHTHQSSLYKEPIKINRVNKVNDSLVCVSIKNLCCPFVDRIHKRDSPPLYILINPQGMSLRCYNEECSDSHFPQNPIELDKDVSDYFNKSNQDEYPYFIKSLSRTHYDVGKLLYEVYKTEFNVEGVKANDDWFKFQQHRWERSPNLWNVMSDSFVDKIISFDPEDESGLVAKLITQLKTVSFKASLLKEAAHIFHNYDPHFVRHLDENSNLMCFNNGVLDLSKDSVIFRPGKTRDYVTFSTNINFIDYNPTHSTTIEVENFLSQLFVDPEVKTYMIKTIASCLLGGSDEFFHIWSGIGSNGKSSLIQLIELTLGDYAAKLPVSLITNKRAVSNAASPEVIRTKGRRFISMQEPEHGDDVKVGLLKELTGKDKIVARELYKNSIEFMPQFKIFLCCNDLPIISADDYGTWRRMRVVEFKSHFTLKR